MSFMIIWITARKFSAHKVQVGCTVSILTVVSEVMIWLKTPDRALQKASSCPKHRALSAHIDFFWGFDVSVC